ncbi:hypothetical protein M3Y97_00567300 [Aphelenchoides bicaudatus]|nr:hypothetical protein M3Y97_00567300 [Aphelenchoides bicaudatus]
MQLTGVCLLRRMMNSSYHPFIVIPKPSRWPKRERLRRFIAWQYASKRETVSKGAQTLSKTLNYMNMQRTDEKHLKRFYSEERLNSALDAHHLEYMHFRDMLEKAHILIDNSIISQLALYEPRTFQSIVNLTKAMAVEDGRVILTEEGVETVELDEQLFGEPIPKSREFAKGPAKDHKVKPRKLRFDEF